MSKRPTGSHFTSSKTSIFFTSRSKPNSPCPPPHNHTTCPPPQNHSTCPPRRNHSPHPPQQNHTTCPPPQNHSTCPPRRNHSPRPPQQNHSPRPPQQNHSTCPPRRNHSPRPLPDFFSQEVEGAGVVQSPGTKRKFADADLTNLLINKIDALTDQVMDLNKKYENSTEEIRRLRKTNDKIEKITYTLAKTQKYDHVINEAVEQLPVVNYNGKNLLDGLLPPSPTALLCKLVRRLYSTDEIVEGVKEDPRMLSIKEAVCAAYYSSDTIKFDVFWKIHGIKTLQGQARSQKSRDKKTKSNQNEKDLIDNENEDLIDNENEEDLINNENEDRNSD
ncbi:unnamed protein product [Rotaria magnacalcarata]|uniref:Uncharacterized protein n=2 Tax=Rotaria magnacalcarata TaxID=392030 RepID=A0A8S2NXU4_9BILA|nr:unnamed protein product [Rotaria magnacalcarata]